MAAAAIHALEHHVERLVDDNANARLFAERLAELDSIRVDLERVETNLVFFEVDAAWGTAAQFSHLLKERGVHINPAGGPQRLRACTHLDVSEADVIVAAEAIRDILSTTVTESATAIGTYG